MYLVRHETGTNALAASGDRPGTLEGDLNGICSLGLRTLIRQIQWTKCCGSAAEGIDDHCHRTRQRLDIHGHGCSAVIQRTIQD